MVTASHNPPQDNGYKVYLGDGSQIVPPADADIAALIRSVAAHPLDEVPRSPVYATLGAELVHAYLARAASLVPDTAPRQISWVYTPLHGVGGLLVVSEPPGGEPARWPIAGLQLLGLAPESFVVGPPAFACHRQVSLCPDRYPRRTGVPAKRPLW